MKNYIILLLLIILSSCTPSSTEDKWASEPLEIKHSEKREKEVWGHVLRGRDAKLFYGTPVYEIAEAISNKDIEKVKELVSKLLKDQINYREDKFMGSLSEFAVSYRDFESLKILTEKGADPNLKKINNNTAFLRSVRISSRYHDDRFMEYLINNGGDVNSIANKYETPLMIASGGKLSDVKTLVKAGADPYYRLYVKESGQIFSPLKSALSRRKIEIVNYYLFDIGVDYKSVSNYNKKGQLTTIIDYIARMEFKEGKKGDEQRKLQKKLIEHCINVWGLKHRDK